MTSIERDLADRVCRVRTMDEYGTGSEFTLGYDEHGHAGSVQERIGSLNGSMRTYTTTYTYDKDDRVTQTGFGDEKRKATRTYDALGRVSTRKVYADYTYPALDAKYTYLDGAPISGVSAKSTTPLVSAITQDGMSFEYTYDAKTSNLTSVRYIAGNTPTDADKYTYYVYDALGQLVRVNDQTDTTAGADGTTWVYEYDFGGNILRKKRYPYQTGELAGTPETIEYEYTDANWKDKVTSIGGKTIDYDAIGNVINDGEWTYSWQAGKQLKSMSKVGTDIVYDYDHNGIRIRKSVTDASGTVRTEYVVNDKRILHMVHGGENLHFYYDGTGRVSMVSFKGVKYAYVHNLQGDVVGLLDAAGNVVVEYSYDAWGKPLAVTGGMADTVGKLNPFRYRGYVWDEETGLYYLRSRYYRPEWGRFLNADDATILQSTNTDLNNRNIFAYCDNRPTIAADMDGEIWGISVFVGIAVGALVEGATSAVCQITANLMEGKNAFDDVGSAMVTGLIDGALTMCPMGKKLYAVASAGLAAVEYIAQSMKKPEEGFNLIEMLGDMFIAGGMALLEGGSAVKKYTKRFNTLDKELYKKVDIGWSTKDFGKIKKAESYYWRNVRHQFPKQLIAPIVKDGIKSLPSAVFIDTAIRGVKATIFT